MANEHPPKRNCIWPVRTAGASHTLTARTLSLALFLSWETEAETE